MNLEELEYLAANQFGLFTTAQAELLGVERVKTHRLFKAGKIRLVRRGVYSTLRVSKDSHEELRAAWLSLDPSKTVAERLSDEKCAVVATRSAAEVHGLGNFYIYSHDFFSLNRKQSRAEDIHIRVRNLPDSDVEIIDGLKVTTLTRTILDLLADGEELEHISDLLVDAVEKRLKIDWRRIRNESSRFEKTYGMDAKEIFESLAISAKSINTQSAWAQSLVEMSYPDIQSQIAKQWSQQFQPLMQQITLDLPTINVPTPGSHPSGR